MFKQTHLSRRCIWAFVLVLLAAPTTRALEPVAYETETLDNGLQVIYAPLHQAPVVHVRLGYHVGSKDERPDRRGFAHMFEHMMFRGSAHVPPEGHMKLIDDTGGDCNASTSFDQTVYEESIPANQLELALWLEADRMASFKVDENIFKTERKVVAEEWRMGRNQPYGTVLEDFLAAAFKVHPYRWSTIGDMDDLRRAHVEELQDFFNKYYVPNNATLVIAGDIDVPSAKQMVRRYFAWIPRTAPIVRDIAQEPAQDAARRAELTQSVPLPLVLVAFHTPDFKSEDQYALSALMTILGGGDSARLQRELVHGEKPIAAAAFGIQVPLEDPGAAAMGAVALMGKDPAEIERQIDRIVADVVEHGVTEDELNSVKTRQRVSTVSGRETAEEIASSLLQAAMIGGDASRVNGELDKIDALTVQDVQAVAKKYLRPENSVTLVVKSSLLGFAAQMLTKNLLPASAPTTVAASTRPVVTREVQFPVTNYPTTAPVSDKVLAAHFEKGEEKTIRGVRVIVLSDHRLPQVGWNLTMRRGGHAEPAGKDGLGDITAKLMRRGIADLDYNQLNTDLESKGIWLDAYDGADFTRLGTTCPTEQVDHAATRMRQMLMQPRLPEVELKKLKEQALSGLKIELETPTSVATRQVTATLYGDSPLGRLTSAESIRSITLDDVKDFFRRVYRPNDAFLVFFGDIEPQHAYELADKLLAGWEPLDEPPVNYTLPPAPKRQILLIDAPSAKQAVVRLSTRAYELHDDEKFAGSVAGNILSSGIESRLGKYVRAAKGLGYSVWGGFTPARHGGSFNAGTDTAIESTADTIEAIVHVLEEMRSSEVTPLELATAKRRVAGGMVMAMQTIGQQASMRGDGILNGYPIDYYDRYPAQIERVTASQVRDVMAKYAGGDQMAIVVVAPAKEVKDKLERLGQVEVLPMPGADQKAAATRPATRSSVRP